eukprot:2028689-Rhodomonas_salina.1
MLDREERAVGESASDRAVVGELDESQPQTPCNFAGNELAMRPVVAESVSCDAAGRVAGAGDA